MVNALNKNVNKKIENSKTKVREKIEIQSISDAKEQEILKKIRDEVLQRFKEYKTTLNYMAADAPIEILCLPKSIEKCLIDGGHLRIYDLFDVDFTKIKGLGVARIRHLTSCLDKFFSML